MKKSIFVILSGLVIASLFLQLTSAYYLPSVRGFSQNIIDSWVDFGSPILNALFGGFGWTGFYLFERLLLFILLISVIYLSLGKVPLFEEQRTIRWVVAIIIPLIGIRFIDYAWLTSIFEQYKALAIIIMAVFPFITYFLFLYNVAGDHGIIRKMGWLIFIGIYLGLWSGATSEGSSAIYFWTVVAAVVCLLGDNIIDRRYRALQRGKSDQQWKDREVGRINQEIATINQQIVNNHISQRAGRELIKKLVADKEYLLRHVH